jgi:hypothetical protein
MQRHKFNKDLLMEWARQHDAKQRRRRVLGSALGGMVLVGGIAELGFHGTPYVLGSVLGVAVALVLLSIGIGYSGFLFYLAWSYAKWCQDKGQTRPLVVQVLTILLLAALGALPIAAFTIRDEVDGKFWVALGFLLWNNASVSVLGYMTRFLLQPR